VNDASDAGVTKLRKGLKRGCSKSKELEANWISFCTQNQLKNKSDQKIDRHTVAFLSQFIRWGLQAKAAEQHGDHNAAMIMHAFKNTLIDAGYVDSSYRGEVVVQEGAEKKDSKKDDKKDDKDRKDKDGKDKKDKKERKDKKDKKDKKRSKEGGDDDKDGDKHDSKKRKTEKSDIEKAAVPKSAGFSVSSVFEDGGKGAGKGGQW